MVDEVKRVYPVDTDLWDRSSKRVTSTKDRSQSIQ